MSHEKLIEKLRKIKALADRWIAWEAVVARNMLNKLLEENWITIDELDRSVREERSFPVTDWQYYPRKLFMQCLGAMFWNEIWDVYLWCYKDSWCVALMISEVEYAELKIYYDFYLWKRKSEKKLMIEHMYFVFLQKNWIFSEESIKWVKWNSDNLDVEKLRMISWAMEKHEFVKPLESK